MKRAFFLAAGLILASSAYAADTSRTATCTVSTDPDGSDFSNAIVETFELTLSEDMTGFEADGERSKNLPPYRMGTIEMGAASSTGVGFDISVGSLPDPKGDALLSLSFLGARTVVGGLEGAIVKENKPLGLNMTARVSCVLK